MTRDEAFEKFTTVLWNKGRAIGLSIDIIAWKGELHDAALEYAHAAASEASAKLRAVLLGEKP